MDGEGRLAGIFGKEDGRRSGVPDRAGRGEGVLFSGEMRQDRIG